MNLIVFDTEFTVFGLKKTQKRKNTSKTLWKAEDISHIYILKSKTATKVEDPDSY